MSKEPSSKAEILEKEIMRRIAASGIRLRTDKVALRLIDNVKVTVGAGSCC